MKLIIHMDCKGCFIFPKQNSDISVPLQVLPAFSNFIDWLKKESLEFQFIFRNFKSTPPEAMQLLAKIFGENYAKATFDTGEYKEQFENCRPIELDMSEVYEHWCKVTYPIFVTDDFKQWDENDREWMYGKIFPFSSAKNSPTLSLYFLANDTNTIAPYDMSLPILISGEEAQKRGLVFDVDKNSASENSNYFIKAFQELLKIHSKCKKTLLDDLKKIMEESDNLAKVSKVQKVDNFIPFKPLLLTPHGSLEKAKDLSGKEKRLKPKKKCTIQ